jgi:hypothetical protein
MANANLADLSHLSRPRIARSDGSGGFRILWQRRATQNRPALGFQLAGGGAGPMRGGGFSGRVQPSCRSMAACFFSGSMMRGSVRRLPSRVSNSTLNGVAVGTGDQTLRRWPCVKPLHCHDQPKRARAFDDRKRDSPPDFPAECKIWSFVRGHVAAPSAARIMPFAQKTSPLVQSCP